MYRAPWMAIWPGAAISLAVFGFNMLGDALRDVLDPRLRGGGGGRSAEQRGSGDVAAAERGMSRTTPHPALSPEGRGG